MRIHRDDEGPDVQGCTFARGDPGLIDLYQLFDRFHAERFVNERDAEPVVGEVEPCLLYTSCSRDVIARGAEQLGWELDTLLERTLGAMKRCEPEIAAAVAQQTT